MAWMTWIGADVRTHHGTFPIIRICYVTTLSTILDGHASRRTVTVSDYQSRVVSLQEANSIIFRLELSKCVRPTSSYIR